LVTDRSLVSAQLKLSGREAMRVLLESLEAGDVVLRA
jgi:hypothetical protein